MIGMNIYKTAETIAVETIAFHSNHLIKLLLSQKGSVLIEKNNNFTKVRTDII